MVVSPPPKTSGPTNPGPYSKHRGFPIGDRMEPDDWRGVFDDYEEGSDKIGYPSVGIRGTVSNIMFFATEENVEELKRLIVDMRSGYRFQLDTLRGRMRNLFGGKARRWLEEALDAVRLDPPFIAAVVERLEHVIKIIDEEVAGSLASQERTPSTLGSIEGIAHPVGALCAYCRVPFVVVAPDRGQCPSCGRPTSISRILEAPNHNDAPRQRKQLAINAPKEQKLQPNRDLEEGGKEIAQDRPRDGTVGYDMTMYPRMTGPDLGA